MTTYEPEIWKRLNECECVKKAKSQWFIGDKLWDDYGGEYGYIIGFNQTEFLDNHIEETARVQYYSGLESNLRTVSCEKFWIVPIFDSIRPERSLIGIVMVKYDVELHVNQGWVCHLLDKQSGAYLYGGYDTARPDLFPWVVELM